MSSVDSKEIGKPEHNPTFGTPEKNTIDTNTGIHTVGYTEMGAGVNLSYITGARSYEGYFPLALRGMVQGTQTVEILFENGDIVRIDEVLRIHKLTHRKAGFLRREGYHDEGVVGVFRPEYANYMVDEDDSPEVVKAKRDSSPVIRVGEPLRLDLFINPEMQDHKGTRIAAINVSFKTN